MENYKWLTISLVALLTLFSVSVGRAEILQVPAYATPTVTSSTVLQEGQLYVIEARGTYIFWGTGGAEADAEWYERAIAPYPWFEFSPDPCDDPSILDLLVNGTGQDWMGTADLVVTSNSIFSTHTYSPSHTYRLNWLGAGESITFKIEDGSGANILDNSGSLEVEITVAEPVCGEVVYFNDFEDAADPLTDWSYTDTNITPGTSQHPTDTFLGPFGSSGQDTDNVTLTLNIPQPHNYVTVSFDLYCMGSWDGNGDTAGTGPDEWDLRIVGGQVLLHTTFSNEDYYNHQAYPDSYPGGINPAGTGAAEIDTLGISYQLLGDSVYHFSFTFPHSVSTLVLEFSSYLTVSNLTNDENWGLDNVTVEICEPADPTELLMDLAQDVIDLNLQQGISNSLDAKLDAAMQALDDINENNDAAAINTLEAFINAVEAQRGNKIPEADADALIAAVQEIITLLSAE